MAILYAEGQRLLRVYYFKLQIKSALSCGRVICQNQNGLDTILKLDLKIYELA